MSSTYHGPINPNPGPGEARIIIYSYVPSLALGIIGAVTFVATLAANIVYMIRIKRHRIFHLLLAVGALMECGGYGARIYSHTAPFSVSGFVAQYFLIVVAPVLFSAAIYLSLQMGTNSTPGADAYLVVRPKVVLAFFITADCVTTIIQVIGAALIGKSESASVGGEPFKVTPEQANNILIAGLAVQTFSFICFFLVLGIAIYRCYRQPNLPGSDGSNGFRPYLLIVLVTSFLILLRTIFRLAESAQGFFGFASTHEALFGSLEYAPVILALAIWSVLPPSRFLMKPQSQADLRGSEEKSNTG